MTKEEILKIIYPSTSANYFSVNQTSYLYKQAEEVAEKLAKQLKPDKFEEDYKTK